MKNQTKWHKQSQKGKNPKKKGISLKIMGISLVGAVLFPLSAYSSTEVETESSTFREKAETIYSQISSGDLDSAIRGILGALGIINPAHQSQRASSSEEEENPYANPETPEEVWELEQHTDILRSKMPQKLSQIVFSAKGQEKMARESEAIKAIEEASYQATQSAYSAQNQINELVVKNIDYVNGVENKASAAQGEKASQNVLKALAEQNRDISQIMKGNSEQLGYLAQIATNQSSQLSGLSTQLTALHKNDEILKVLMGSQNYLLSQVDDALGQQKDYQQYKDSLARGLDQNASRAIFIPGLFKDDVSEQ